MIFKNFKILAVSFFFIMTSAKPLFGGGNGDVVNNGGGMAENNVVYTFLHLKEKIESCLYSKNCALTIPEKELLQKIYDSYEQELTGSGVRFMSSKEHPEVFTTDATGTLRTAVTGNDIGSPIIFNIERLYPEMNGKTQAIDMLSAISLLIHELGHHHGVSDHTYLDRLGGKVRTFIDNVRMQSIDLRKFKDNPLTVSVFSQKALFEVNLVPIVDTRIQVNIANGYTIYDLSDLFIKSNRCPQGTSFIDSSSTDLLWSPIPAFDNLSGTQTIRFQVVVNWSCNPWPQEGEKKIYSQTIEVSNQFKVQSLNRIDLFNWKLSEILYPSSWRGESDIILVPQFEWMAKEISCEKIDYNLNPLGACDNR